MRVRENSLLMSITLKLVVALAAFFASLEISYSETVNVRYRGLVDLAPFDCTSITRSSFIDRVCYDKAEQYLVISLKGTFYHYCEIGAGTVAALLVADSMGRYYNQNIKGTGSDGPFDCRTHRAPKY